MQIFISYKRENEPFARLVRENLLAWGYAVWMDKVDLPPGVSWADNIQKALHQCDAVIGILSPLAVESENVKNEWDFAQNRQRKWLILLMYEGCEVPLNQSRLTHINCEGNHQAEGLEKLRLALTLPPPRNERRVDDPFQNYLDGLYDQINHALGQKILATLRNEQDIPELIELTGESTPQAVHGLFSNQPELHPMFVALGVTPQEPETTFTNMQVAFDSFGGRMLLLGEPGAGKTMTLLKMCRDAVIQRLVDPSKPLPILGSITTWNARERTPIAEWLIATNPLLRDSTIPIIETIQQGRALLLLDGLDELGGERLVDRDKPDGEKFDPRQRFLDALPANNQILVTCRRQDYAEIGSKAKLNGAITLQPLSKAQIASYLRGTQALWQAVQNDDDLREIAKTPLLLSFFAFAYHDHPEDAEQLANLADSPGDLRDAIFERYVRERYEHEERKLKMRGEEMPFTLADIRLCLEYKAVRDVFQTILSDDTSEIYVDFMLDFDNADDHSSNAEAANEEEDALISSLLEYCVHLNLLTTDSSIEDPAFYLWIHQLLRNFFASSRAMRRITSSSVREKAAMILVLGEVREQRAQDFLITELENNQSLAPYMVWAFGRIGGNRAAQLLLSYLGQELRRQADIYHAPTPTPPDDLKGLDRFAWKLNHSPNFQWIQAIITAIVSTKEVGTLSKLMEVQNLYPYLISNRTIIDAAGNLQVSNDDVTSKILAFLTAESMEERRYGIISAEKIRDPRLVPYLIQLLGDTVYQENGSIETNCPFAAEALKAIGTPEALDAIKEIDCPENIMVLGPDDELEI